MLVSRVRGTVLVSRVPRVWLALLLCGACGQEAPAQTRLLVSFVSESEPGLPLAEVPVFVDGERVGRSDSDGLVQTLVTGPPSRKLSVRYDCPKGHSVAREDVELRLPDRSVPGAELDTVELLLSCVPRLRSVAIAVRAKGGGELPVLVNGEPVTQTNAAGIAHWVTKLEPGAELELQLDTSKHPSLRPRSPARHFQVADRDEAFVLAQTFHRVRRPKPKTQKPRRIIRIE